MKKWIFVIAPAVMLGLFLAYYSSDRKRVSAREEQYKAAQQQKIDDKKRKDDDMRAKTKQDQMAKDAEKLREEQAKEAEKVAKEAADRKGDLDATAIAKSNFAQRTGEIRTIDAQIGGVQKQRDQLLKEILNLSKSNEQAKIDRRSAELEFERTKAQLLGVLAQDPLMQMPVAPVAPGGPGGGGRGRGGP
ncbi:MAG: hypothetical protein RL324_2373 [Verrucomicrobiota bacterium]|jgi:flagellar biosynthesis GTPase FlhF